MVILTGKEYQEYADYRAQCEEEAEEWDNEASIWESSIDSVCDSIDDIWENNEFISNRIDDIEEIQNEEIETQDNRWVNYMTFKNNLIDRITKLEDIILPIKDVNEKPTNKTTKTKNTKVKSK